MRPNKQPQNGYMMATRHTGSPRSIEYQVFSRVTGKINDASSESASFSELADALHENIKLWNAIAIDVVDDGNQLPTHLRAQLLYLTEFTIAHTRKVLNRTADASALVDINTAIMRGLRQTAPPQEVDQCPA